MVEQLFIYNHKRQEREIEHQQREDGARQGLRAIWHMIALPDRSKLGRCRRGLRNNRRPTNLLGQEIMPKKQLTRAEAYVVFVSNLKPYDSKLLHKMSSPSIRLSSAPLNRLVRNNS